MMWSAADQNWSPSLSRLGHILSVHEGSATAASLAWCLSCSCSRTHSDPRWCQGGHSWWALILLETQGVGWGWVYGLWPGR